MITIVDRLIHKSVSLKLPDSVTQESLQKWDIIVYKNDEWKVHCGEYVWYGVEWCKECTFMYKLSDKQKESFDSYQSKASELYTLFKEQFRNAFPESVPLCARMSLHGDQIYFYFYAETRFNFAEFVRSFRERIKMKFFLYQVWARDRVRLHPNLDEWFDSSGLPLSYSIFAHPLDLVDSKVIDLQGLAWRDIETLKDRSWKLDHSLAYEQDIYEEELKRYPSRWSTITHEWCTLKCVWTNILLWETKRRTVIPNKDSNSDRVILGERKELTIEEYEAIPSTSS